MKLLDSVRNFVFPRCAHLSPSGRRCSQPVCSSNPSFCFIHSPKPDDDPAPDQAFQAELAQAAATLDSPDDVRRILSKLFVAVLEDRIPLRKARLLNAMSQTLLRAHREIAYHQKLKDQNPYEEEDIFDVPRPIRDDPDPLPPPQLPAIQSHNSALSDACSLSSRPEHASCAVEGSWQVQCPTTNPDSQASLQSSKNNIVAAPAISSVEPLPSEPTTKPAPKTSPRRATPADPRTIVGTFSQPSSFSANPLPVAESCSLTQDSLVAQSPSSIVTNTKKSQPALPTTPSNPPDLRHFYPWDPTLPPGTQDPWSNIPPEYRPDSPRNRNPRRRSRFLGASQ